MNYGFFDAANDNHQATLLFDPTAAPAGSNDSENPATQHSGMEVSIMCAFTAAVAASHRICSLQRSMLLRLQCSCLLQRLRFESQYMFAV